ncbi:cytochrome c3 family protein [Caldinitratiruptor microaerophilus]|uniref:Uncharacterized protein n=1 Tax=Caldinitratiruptor microaerophilus TaxID=671077 RepID=A0AA35G9F0_9FIRM|nr:cytochrome c3 family protein [Caldinitratiruptor microaerophilus]BDG62031.1 hypothetical protein caldi_31210 [Caldinitratiruptor microaerophilus]
MRRLNLAIPGLAAMIVFIAGLATIQSLNEVSPDPRRLAADCGTCHEMAEHVRTWESAPHAEVACTACHADPGVRGWFHMQLARLRMTLATRTGDVDLARIASRVPDQRCTACHAPQMPWVMQDLEPPDLAAARAGAVPERRELKWLTALAGHDVHLTRARPAVACADCHAAVAHGPADPAERKVELHRTCRECHERQQVTVAVSRPVTCAGCHADPLQVAPAGHRSSDWRERHGAEARTDAASCAGCHLSPAGPHGGVAKAASPIPVPASRPPVGKAPSAPPGLECEGFGPDQFVYRPVPGVTPQGDCASCHGLPMPHPDGWIRRHTEAYRDSPALCARCHGTEGQGFDLAFRGDPARLANQGSCRDCHRTDVPHPDGFLRTHGQEARAAGDAACALCHSPQNPVRPDAPYARPDFCTSCHAGVPMPHPPGYEGRPHGEAVLAAAARGSAGTAACNRCHSPDNPANPSAAWARPTFCLDCHLDRYRHPDGWMARHGREVAAAGGTREQPNPECAVCHAGARRRAGGPPHTGADPGECTSCHTGGPYHPDPYAWFKHGDEVARQGVETCLRCHAWAGPSCSQCHRDLAGSH